MVFVVRAQSGQADFKQLKSSVDGLLKRARLYKKVEKE